MSRCGFWVVNRDEFVEWIGGCEVCSVGDMFEGVD